MKDFNDKVAIVTGAGSGIGAAIAIKLAAHSAQVVAADIDMASAVRTVTQISDTLGNPRPCQVDVADPRSVEQMVAFAVEAFGGLHLALNNAGIGGPSATTANYPLEDWQKIIDVNLSGASYGLKYEIAAMLKSGGGAIVNMSSNLGAVGWQNACAYVSTKPALIGLTKTAAIEYAGHNIRINAVGPAFIDTPLLTKNLDAETVGQLAALHPLAAWGQRRKSQH